MDLDFTLCAKDQDDILEKLISVFNEEHHGIAFKADDFYFSEQATSFGGDICYSHSWNNAGVFKLQVSLREKPTLRQEVLKRVGKERPYISLFQPS